MDKTVFLFDIGNVLIKWTPDPLLRELNDAGPQLPYETFRSAFMSLIFQWDRGTLDRDGEKTRKQAPELAQAAQSYTLRFQETLPYLIEGTIEIAAQLKALGHRLYLASNWAADAFEETAPRMTFLPLFDGKMISGFEGVIKPDPAFFHQMMRDFNFDAREAVFIDDTPGNVEAAQRLGIDSILFEDPAGLRQKLIKLGVDLT